MKRLGSVPLICSALILIAACIIGSVKVSALSAEGQVILTQLASVGASLGFDVNDYIGQTDETSSQEKTTSQFAEEDLKNFVDSLGLDKDLLSVTDMIASLNGGESLEAWVGDNYGYGVTVPDSVKDMSAKDIALCLLEMYLSPSSSSSSSAQTDTGGYVFIPSQTAQTSEISIPAASNATSVPDYIFKPSSSAIETVVEQKDAYTTGDANNDGKINSADARLALRVSAELELLSDAAYNAADVNGDGSVTAKDARSILRFSAGLSAGF